MAWPKTTFQPQKGDNRSWAREDPVHRDRIVDLESRNRTIMGTDPGPGRHRPEPVKHESVASVVMSALCSRDSRVSLFPFGSLSRDSSLLISRLSRDYIYMYPVDIRRFLRPRRSAHPGPTVVKGPPQNLEQNHALTLKPGRINVAKSTFYSYPKILQIKT